MIIIHSCNDRKQYVEHYLIPSLVKQGFWMDQIILFNDDDNLGCLQAFVKSCRMLNEQYANTGFWHLQDDVVIADDFYERVMAFGDSEYIINGFVCKKHNPNDYDKIGWQSNQYYWMSFQCVYIPSKYITAFLDWFNKEIEEGHKYKHYYERNRHCDFFFYKSVQKCYPNDLMYNAFPAMVDHIDYLLGGSVITKEKKYIRQAEYWNEPRGVLKK